MPQLSLSGLVLAVGGVVIAASFLTGFAYSATAPSGPCESPYTSGKASSLVSAVELDNGQPVANFPTPLRTTGRELSVILEGEGYPAYPHSYLDFDASVFVGSDQEFLTGSSWDPLKPIRREINPEGDDFFGALLECQLPGSRIAITTTVEDIFGPIQEDDTIQNSSTVVILVDVHQTYPRQAGGSDRLPQSGLPTVVVTPEGVHGLSFPNAPIPADLRVSVLKQGTGPAISEGDLVTTHFTAAVWNTRQIFVTSFERELPLSFNVTDVETAASGVGIIEGLSQGLVGQTVGSRVLISVPPDLGYAPGTAPVGVPDGATLVYVFDILGVTQ